MIIKDAIASFHCHIIIKAIQPIKSRIKEKLPMDPVLYCYDHSINYFYKALILQVEI